MSRIALSLCAVAAAIGLTTATHAATVDFESFTLNEVFGASRVPANVPGDFISDPADPIAMTVEQYQRGGNLDFWNATVVPNDTGKALFLDSIGIKFDFSALSAVSIVELDYIIHDSETLQNIWVNANGSGIQEERLFADLIQSPATSVEIAPGVNMAVNVISNDPNRRIGKITLTSDPSGGIYSLQIGGQELEIDNVVAIPEPGSLALLGLAVAGLIYNRRTRTR